MVLELPNLIGQTLALMRTCIERAQRQEANAVERAVAYLDAAQEGTAGLGKTAQLLHNAAASFDPVAVSAEEDAQQLLKRVNDYLHVNDLTLELDGVVLALRRIGDELEQSGGRHLHLPKTKRRRSEAVADMRSVLDEVLALLNEIAGLTRHIPAGTGIGASTLREIEDVLSSAIWRDRPAQAKERLRDAAEAFRASPENSRWLELAPRFPELKQGLLGAFPA